MNYKKMLEKCELCPHNCKVNRINGEIGRCKASSKVKIALANLHYYEEPCISGKNGSGTVFFSGCNMSCKYCQNYKISQELHGEEISIKELAENFLKLQNSFTNGFISKQVILLEPITKALKI